MNECCASLVVYILSPRDPNSDYLKYNNPCIANVVKVDRPFVRIGVASSALIVILVPVDTHATDVELLPDRSVVVIVILVQAAFMAPLLQWGDLMTPHDAIIS